MTRAKRMLSKRAMVSIAFTVALVLPAGAWALGLGEARVESFLNQPLDVRMRLLDVSDDDLDSLTVTPASPEDFERLGLMSSSLALGIQVEVDRSVSPAVVRITSARPVTDPVVQLLVDARWASGRMLREYTLFLDPPTVAVEPPAPARPAAQQTRSTADAADIDADREAAAPARPAEAPRARESRPRQPRPVAASGSRSYGPVASGDTLWSIARANLPTGDVSMNQMMIAIVELNPNAFRDRNINQLLRGAELQLPDAEQVRALDEAAAAAEVAAQNRAFRSRTTSDVPVVSSAGRDSSPADESPATPDMAGRPEGGEAADSADHRLSLVPPGEEESGSGLSEDAAEVANLRQRLARAEEELYAARQEAEEFEARVEDLEAAIRDNPGGIGLRDAELAGLEATLRAAREATREDADPQLRAEVSDRLEGYLEQYEAAADDGDTGAQLASNEPESDAGEDAMGASERAESATPAGAAAAEADPVDAAAPAPARPVTEIENSRGLLGNPMLLLFAGLVVLLVILAIVRTTLRRGRKSADTETPVKRADDLPKAQRPAEDPTRAARARVTEHPDELAAHLALLQTLATDGNQDEFGEALDAMYAHVDSDSQAEWREALELAGRVVPGHSLVKGSTDWIAEPSGRDADQPASEVDEESEVDDLMTRLDADLDDSDDSDDRDWLGEEESEPSPPAGELLRDDEASSPEDASDRDDGHRRFTGTGTEVLDPIDSDEETLEDVGEWGQEEELGGEDTSRRTTRPDTHGEGADDERDFVMDWPDDDEPTEKVDAGRSAEDAGEGFDTDAGEDHAEDDIFAQSDDDIDVKLDLAKAYLSWNSVDSARTLLEEVAREGNESQREEARKLLDDLSDGSED